MQIIKVLNNSLVLAENENSEDVILFGKGIGYNYSVGTPIDMEQVEKIFVGENNKLSDEFHKLASEIDEKYFELASKIIQYSVEKHQMELDNHVYIALTDHLAFVHKRLKENLLLPNYYTWEMRKFNSKEYDVGLFGINLLQEEFLLDIPEGEAGSIAFHFINAQINVEQSIEENKINYIVSDILDIVKYHYHIEFKEDSINYTRFVTHLRFFAQRLIAKVILDPGEMELYEQITNEYGNELECVLKIKKYVQKNQQVIISKDEIIYLLLHTRRIINEVSSLK